MVNNEYIRVGIQYYKFIEEPVNDEENKTIRRIVKWSRNTIIDDHGKDFCMAIEKFDDFVLMPSHDNYKEKHGKFYNIYHPLSGEIEEGDCSETLEFLKHIFGSQFEIGLDYLTILWRYPKQILPILCLVSEERETGKTTFLNWLRELFGDNMTIMKSESFRSRFNNDWTSKLLICIDEAKFDKRSDSDYIKDLSTSRTINEEGKNVNKRERPFYGKIIMSSNNVNDMAIIDENEKRFWVIEVNKIENYKNNFEAKLRSEIPAFKYFIKNRKIKNSKETRMWFKASNLKTHALSKMMRNSVHTNEKEIAEILLQYSEISAGNEIKLTLKNIYDICKQEGVYVKKHEIKNIMNNRWKILPADNSTSYKYYVRHINYATNSEKIEVFNCKGRVFSIEKDFLLRKVENC
jgi:hypothetical protein